MLLLSLYHDFCGCHRYYCYFVFLLLVILTTLIIVIVIIVVVVVVVVGVVVETINVIPIASFPIKAPTLVQRSSNLKNGTRALK